MEEFGHLLIGPGLRSFGLRHLDFRRGVHDVNVLISARCEEFLEDGFSALMSLFLGAMSGVHSSIATTGFAANVRDALFKKIQTFSFKNIDKFSTASLVTRTTTDVNNVQMGFMQILRIATRTPAMLVLSMTMCFIISPKLSTIFLIAVAVVGSVMPMIGRLAGKTFSSVFQRYDTINARVEENVTGARVVKAFVRQDYESEKYARATHDLRSKFVKAEMVVAMNIMAELKMPMIVPNETATKPKN